MAHQMGVLFSASFKLALRDCLALIENYGGCKWGFVNPVDYMQSFFYDIDNAAGFAVRNLECSLVCKLVVIVI